MALIFSIFIQRNNVIAQSYPSSYGGSIKNIQSGEIIYLECTHENLQSSGMCKEFEIVVTDETASFTRRVKKFSLKAMDLKDLIANYRDEIDQNIKKNTEAAWFGTTKKMYHAVDTATNPLIDEYPVVGIPLGIIVGIPTILVIPVIGFTFDLFKLPYVAIKNALDEDNAYEYATNILGHLFNRRTSEMIEISDEEYYDLGQVLLYL